MTAKLEDLIRELRSEIGAGFTAMDQAADRLEELQAQNRRLREALQYFKDRGYYEAWKTLDPKESADWLDRALDPQP